MTVSNRRVRKLLFYCTLQAALGICNVLKVSKVYIRLGLTACDRVWFQIAEIVVVENRSQRLGVGRHETVRKHDENSWERRLSDESIGAEEIVEMFR